MSTFIIIPAYNEAENISRVIRELKENQYTNIIVVNDGSKDDTKKIAEKAGATVLNHIINRGQGASLQTGINYALKKGAEYIVTFDADGQHKAKEIEKLLEPIKKGEYEVTLGSRFLENKSKIPILRRILLKGSTIIDWIFSGGKRLTDAHNGFRAFSRKGAEKIKIIEDGMTHACEIIQQIKKNKLKYLEVPVTVRYTDETLKKGHGSYLQAIKVLIRLIFKKLV